MAHRILNDTIIDGNLTLPSQVQFSSPIYTQFQSLAADLNFKSLLSSKNVVFTINDRDVLSLQYSKAVFNQPLQIVAGSPGAGKVLTSDAEGNAIWSAAGGGGQTINYAQPATAEQFSYSSSNVFTLTKSPAQVLAVVVEQVVLRPEEYLVSGQNITVSPATHTFVSGDAIRVLYQPTQSYTSTGGFNANIVSKNQNYTLVQSDYTVLMDTSGGNRTATLLSAVDNTGKVVVVKKVSTDSNTLTIATTASQTIDGQSTITTQATVRPSFMMQSDGSNWWVI